MVDNRAHEEATLGGLAGRLSGGLAEVEVLAGVAGGDKLDLVVGEALELELVGEAGLEVANNGVLSPVVPERNEKKREREGGKTHWSRKVK